MTSLMESIQSGFKRIGSRLSLTNHHHHHHSNNMNNMNNNNNSKSSSTTTSTTTSSSSTTTTTSSTSNTTTSSTSTTKTSTTTSLKSESNNNSNNMLSPAPPPPSSSFSNEKQKLSTTYNSINNNHHNTNINNNNTNNSKMERISSVPVMPKNIKKQSTIAPCEVEALAKRLMMNNNNNSSTSTSTSSNNTSGSSNSTNTCFHAPLNIVTATACCPKKPNKSRETPTRRDCGEDAVFVCRHFPKNEKIDENCQKIEKSQKMHEKIEKPIDRVCCIGVADGVGSYMLRGIDPSIFAWAIMEETKRVFESEKYISCIDALTRSYNRICDEKLVSAGGSTACIISMHHGVHCETGMPVLKLTAATIGDSAFMVYRNGKIIYRSVEQLHGFNCPYQLSVPRLVDVTKNENLDDGRRNRNGMMAVKQDDPSRAIVIEDEPIDLMRDDVVIVSTDGLTDNVFDEEVAQILSENMKAGMTPKEMAAKMASELLRTAYVKSRSKDSFTPFTKYALEHRQNYVPNGKIDDITFVVAIVS